MERRPWAGAGGSWLQKRDRAVHTSRRDVATKTATGPDRSGREPGAWATSSRSRGERWALWKQSQPAPIIGPWQQQGGTTLIAQQPGLFGAQGLAIPAKGVARIPRMAMVAASIFTSGPWPENDGNTGFIPAQRRDSPGPGRFPYCFRVLTVNLKLGGGPPPWVTP